MNTETDLHQTEQQTQVAVETSIGTLFGRDAIFLDVCDLNYGQGSLTLCGSINGKLASKPVDQTIPFRLTFVGVLALQMIELDSWTWDSVSSFDEVHNSAWIKTLGGKITDEHKHYLIQTYDDVFEVVCKRFRLNLEVQE